MLESRAMNKESKDMVKDMEKKQRNTDVTYTMYDATKTKYVALIK